MNAGQRLLGLSLGLAIAAGASAADIGTAFTYQGFLEDGGGPVTADCDFEFELYDAAADGLQIDGTLNEVVSVEDGLFTVGLDFGPGAFDGSGARWLKIEVCCPSTCAPGGLDPLDPRVELTPAPLALALPGLYTDAAGDTIASGTITSGNSITIDGINDRITSPTTMEIHVGGVRLLQLSQEFDTFLSQTAPNIIGGREINGADAGIGGATISGGGADGAPNLVTGGWGTIGGGLGNTAGSGYFATVGGGVENSASGESTTVGGGSNNTATQSDSTISGGSHNTANGPSATVGGGQQNTVSANAGTVGGGFDNDAAGPSSTTVSGGAFNTAGPGQAATVGGGQQNTASGLMSNVPGGENNVAGGDYSFAAGRKAKANHAGSFVWADSVNADCTSATTNEFRICAAGGVEVEGNIHANGTISSGNSITIDGINDRITSPTTMEIHVGGVRLLQLAQGFDTGFSQTAPNIIGGREINAASAGVAGATISGGGSDGEPNLVTGGWGTIGGGDGNTAGPGVDATVGGGFQNSASGSITTVGGGGGNTASGNVATVGGGQQNRASGTAATVGGGATNTAGPGVLATVGGGQVNWASGLLSTVPGGVANVAAGNYSLAAGRRAKANHGGSFVWADSVNADCTSATTNEFRICAAGGVEVEGNIHASGTISSGNSITIDGTANTINSTGDSAITLQSTGGGVGIGTTNPKGTLHVQSLINVNSGSNFANSIAPLVIGDGDGTGAALLIDGNQIEQANDTDGLSLNFNSAAVVTIAIGGGSVGIGRHPTVNRLEVEGTASKTTSGSWAANSDRRIKQDIKTIEGPLETLQKVRLVSFRYTDEYRAAHPSIDDHRYLNVIAQEFAKVFPNYVKGSGEKLDNSDGEILQVDTYPLTIYAAAAIQELHGIVNQKGGQIMALQAEISELRESIRKMSPSTRASTLGMATPAFALVALIGLVTLGRTRKGGA